MLCSSVQIGTNRDKSLNRYSSPSLQWISLKLMSMKLWKSTLKLMQPESSILCSPVMSKFGQMFESLLLPEFTMDLSETHSNATMDIHVGPQSNMVEIWNLYCVILLPNLFLSTVVTSSLELYNLSLYSGAFATHWLPC